MTWFWTSKESSKLGTSGRVQSGNGNSRSLVQPDDNRLESLLPQLGDDGIRRVDVGTPDSNAITRLLLRHCLDHHALILLLEASPQVFRVAVILEGSHLYGIRGRRRAGSQF